RLLGDVDPDRAPGETPAAPDAARGVELLPPRRQLVGHPLAVPRADRAADRAAVEVGVVQVETGRPRTGPADLPGEIGGVPHIGAETRGADLRAVPTGQ